MKLEDKFISVTSWFIESIFWLMFAVSPILASIVIGGLVSGYIDGVLGYLLWGIIVLIGIIGGIALAENARKRPGGASHHYSKIMASPELDNFDPEKPVKKSNSTSKVRDSGSSPNDRN